MEIQTLIESGKSLNVVIDGWKETAIDFIKKAIGKRRTHSINVLKYKSNISKKNIPTICGSIYEVEEIDICDGIIRVKDSNYNFYFHYNMTHNDLLKLLRLIKAVQRCDNAAKDY